MYKSQWNCTFELFNCDSAEILLGKADHAAPITSPICSPWNRTRVSKAEGVPRVVFLSAPAMD